MLVVESRFLSACNSRRMLQERAIRPAVVEAGPFEFPAATKRLELCPPAQETFGPIQTYQRVGTVGSSYRIKRLNLYT
jgi:hypothetical protein